MAYDANKPQEFSSVTQCPYCRTAFHVGLAQLDVADGRVRCGGCLRVFNAKEHFLVEQRRLFDDEPLSEDTEQQPHKDEAIFQADTDLFDDDLSEDDEPVILGSFNHHSGTSIPRKAILEDKVNEFRQEDYEPASAEQVLGDHQHLLEPGQEAELSTATEADDWENYVSISAIDDDFADADYVEISTADSEEQLINSGMDAAEELLSGNPEYAEKEQDANPPEPWLNSRNDFLMDLPEKLRAAEAPVEDDLADHESSDESEDHTDHFFIQQSARGGRRAGAFWWAALVLVILALPTQLLFTQPDSLVLKPWFQQMGATLCPYLGCTAPVYSAPDMIRISGFIEPHEEYQDSLVAKIDLRNQGLAEQPFPPVAIYFRNLSGTVTASRIFQPSEYLQGETRGMERMPVNRNVQLELEFLDPGEQSTSYELYIAN